MKRVCITICVTIWCTDPPFDESIDQACLPAGQATSAARAAATANRHRDRGVLTSLVDSTRDVFVDPPQRPSGGPLASVGEHFDNGGNLLADPVQLASLALLGAAHLVQLASLPLLGGAHLVQLASLPLLGGAHFVQAETELLEAVALTVLGTTELGEASADLFEALAVAFLGGLKPGLFSHWRERAGQVRESARLVRDKWVYGLKKPQPGGSP